MLQLQIARSIRVNLKLVLFVGLAGKMGQVYTCIQNKHLYPIVVYNKLEKNIYTYMLYLQTNFGTSI